MPKDWWNERVCRKRSNQQKRKKLNYLKSSWKSKKKQFVSSLSTKKWNLRVSNDIAFIDIRLEKRKVIRKLEKVNNVLQDSPLDKELLEKKTKFEDFLTYINHYPPLWKYISLFPNVEAESDESKKVREETFVKVLKMAEVKKVIRDKELWEADVEI